MVERWGALTLLVQRPPGYSPLSLTLAMGAGNQSAPRGCGRVPLTHLRPLWGPSESPRDSRMGESSRVASRG